MISNQMLITFFVVILFIVAFMAKIIYSGSLMMIHRFYLIASAMLISWLVALIGVKFTDPGDMTLMYVWDSLTYIGVSGIPVMSLLFAIAYTNGYERKMPWNYALLMLVPVFTNIMVWTNPIHHMFYRVFSLVNTSVQFGPFFYLHALYTSACTVLSIWIISAFALKTRTGLHVRQAVFFDVGCIVPSIVNLLVMFRLIEATIAVTPLSFVVTLIFHGLIIYRLHFLDIRPIAQRQLLEWISDCYLVTNAAGVVVSYNRHFKRMIGDGHGIRENMYLQDCLKSEDVENKTAVYNLITSLTSSMDTRSKITYEQTMLLNAAPGGELKRFFFMVEITPLLVEGDICGFLTIFKDVTNIKENMQRMQDSQMKMMERERLAFLGQMVGGLAHNLKTPIMSVSGGTTSIENLIEEAKSSLGDLEVTQEDYREIYGEMEGWLGKIREACAYMSDIITAVKGQASNMNASDYEDFSTDEMIKRVALLLRHELLASGCTLKVENQVEEEVWIHGDINNLVQVVNNLISNAIDAQKEDGPHEIVVGITRDEKQLMLTVKDYGTGIPTDIREKLFKQMITSKGNMGTGLGVFISHTVIRAKFDGDMWMEDNPEGGSIFGISIPLENVILKEQERRSL